MLVRVRERRPVANVFGLERDIDRIFRSAFGFDWSAPAPRHGVAVTPDADGVTLRAELPGVEPADIAVAVENHTLTITTAHKAEKAGEGGTPATQRPHRAFSHAFHLSDELDSEAISADCRNGVLTLRIPKRAAARPRQIEVKTS